ncbi:MAG: ribbon-helix-helix domain-containing protein [Rhodospirillales bacterium]|nr:ribbon-helix-helix domain-containing protein [Rhodospirillales bacterium]
MGSSLEPRNVTINGRRTSLRLEPAMWNSLELVCEKEGMEIKDLFSMIDSDRNDAGLTSAIRTFLASYLTSMLVAKRRVRPSIVVRNRRVSGGLQTPHSRLD